MDIFHSYVSLPEGSIFPGKVSSHKSAIFISQYEKCPKLSIQTHGCLQGELPSSCWRHGFGSTQWKKGHLVQFKWKYQSLSAVFHLKLKCWSLLGSPQHFQASPIGPSFVFCRPAGCGCFQTWEYTKYWFTSAKIDQEETHVTHWHWYKPAPGLFVQCPLFFEWNYVNKKRNRTVTICINIFVNRTLSKFLVKSTLLLLKITLMFWCSISGTSCLRQLAGGSAADHPAFGDWCVWKWLWGNCPKRFETSRCCWIFLAGWERHPYGCRSHRISV